MAALSPELDGTSTRNSFIGIGPSLRQAIYRALFDLAPDECILFLPDSELDINGPDPKKPWHWNHNVGVAEISRVGIILDTLYDSHDTTLNELVRTKQSVLKAPSLFLRYGHAKRRVQNYGPAVNLLGASRWIHIEAAAVLYGQPFFFAFANSMKTLNLQRHIGSNTAFLKHVRVSVPNAESLTLPSSYYLDESSYRSDRPDPQSILGELMTYRDIEFLAIHWRTRQNLFSDKDHWPDAKARFFATELKRIARAYVHHLNLSFIWYMCLVDQNHRRNIHTDNCGFHEIAGLILKSADVGVNMEDWVIDIPMPFSGEDGKFPKDWTYRSMPVPELMTRLTQYVPEPLFGVLPTTEGGIRNNDLTQIPPPWRQHRNAHTADTLSSGRTTNISRPNSTGSTGNVPLPINELSSPWRRYIEQVAEIVRQNVDGTIPREALTSTEERINRLQQEVFIGGLEPEHDIIEDEQSDSHEVPRPKLSSTNATATESEVNGTNDVAESSTTMPPPSKATETISSQSLIVSDVLEVHTTSQSSALPEGASAPVIATTEKTATVQFSATQTTTYAASAEDPARPITATSPSRKRDRSPDSGSPGPSPKKVRTDQAGSSMPTVPEVVRPKTPTPEADKPIAEPVLSEQALPSQAETSKPSARKPRTTTKRTNSRKERTKSELPQATSRNSRRLADLPPEYGELPEAKRRKKN
ncbi:hypothetical protein BT63DRAFT_317458 [Microthyrium microscopicum]|uniref:Uncharacterized protein n=1 Tax=Microthyrium microscopicum TaxID=703497 RepID=A0A6A6U588_9PEZI|nr:hypothetical protein BT63DRAFT_317458 [Microthyrium microscopicum]